MNGRSMLLPVKTKIYHQTVTRFFILLANGPEFTEQSFIGNFNSGGFTYNQSFIYRLNCVIFIDNMRC